MTGPARCRTGLVAALTYRRTLGDPNLRILTSLANNFAPPQQRTFGQIHTRDMITITTHLALRAPRIVVAARAGKRVVANRAQRRRPTRRYGHHRHTHPGSGVRQRFDGLTAGGLRGTIVVDAAQRLLDCFATGLLPDAHNRPRPPG